MREQACLDSVPERVNELSHPERRIDAVCHDSRHPAVFGGHPDVLSTIAATRSS